MAKVRTYPEILKFFHGCGLYYVPITVAGSQFAASPFPYLMVDDSYFTYRRSADTEEVYPEEYEEFCVWANENLARRGKVGVRVVFHKKGLRLIRDDQLVDKCPAN